MCIRDRFGSDLDPDTQRTLARGERLVSTLNQKERSPLPVEDQVIQIYAATNGYLDRINVERVEEFLLSLTERARAEAQELRKKIADNQWEDDIEAEVDKLVKEFASDFGYDLDEEGQPLDETAGPEESGRESEPAAAADSDGGTSSGDAEEGAGEPEQEPAAV